MVVLVNGKELEVAERASLAEVVRSLGIGGKGTAVAVNREVVPASLWARTELSAGDRVEVLHAAAGG
jgi:sulfur carrier protein